MSKKRNILLLEPNYKNKYPPLGLMKIATYHRMLNDKVTFYKGDMKQFVISNIVDELVLKLHKIDKTIIFENKKPILLEYIKTGKQYLLEKLLTNSDFNPTIKTSSTCSCFPFQSSKLLSRYVFC